jgi:NADH-quinone oxidoreductase subunit G
MPTIFIHHKPYEVRGGQNLLQACLSLGFDIPYFCWHPALHSVGACRMCAVKQFKDENDTKGKIVMSCMTPATEGTRISIDDPEAVQFRKSVIEWLMINHPHDCPVCDEGGECHLQDMTLMAGHVVRRYRFRKRTHRNQDLGPFVKHEMNRCIQCYRCVRFYRYYAGGRDLNVFCWHDSVYFGRHQDGALQSPFSGNLVEVCPTGVFTDKTFARHFTRVWDLQSTPSICPHCGLGCNILPGERNGTLRRIRNRYHGQVNGYFLCDRGRFGYEFVNSGRRITQALWRKDKSRCEPVSKSQAIADISNILKDSKGVIGIGSARASVESNYALRTLVGADHFYAGVPGSEHEAILTGLQILQSGPVCSASLHEARMADAVFVLGEDLANTAPMLELAIRQSVLNRPAAVAETLHIEPWNDTPYREVVHRERGPLYIAGYGSIPLTDVATATYTGTPDDLARLGFAVAHELDADSPAVPLATDELLAIAKRIAKDLLNAQNPLVVTGTSCGSKTVVKAAANVTYALHRCGKTPRICIVAPCCNSLGLALLADKPLAEALSAIDSGLADTILILENDLYRYMDPDDAERFLNAAKHIIAIDYVSNKSTDQAHYVLPAATFAESDGVYVNDEGRAQRFFKGMKPQGDLQDGWRWIRDILRKSGRAEAEKWKTYDDLVGDLAGTLPVFAGILKTSPRADFRMHGQRIPRQSHRCSGRAAMHANTDVREHQAAQDPDSPLAFSPEGCVNQPPSALVTHFWAPRWNSVQSVTKYQNEVGGELRGGDPGVRLLEPKPFDPAGAGQPIQALYFREIPKAFEAKNDEWLVLPGRHLFGSEELSALSPGIAELSATPHLAVNPLDTENLGGCGPATAEITVFNHTYCLPIEPSAAVPRGTAVVPVGLADLPWDGTPIRLKRKFRSEPDKCGA